MYKARFITFWCLRKIWQILAVSLVLLAVVVSTLKYTLPYANQYKTDIEQLLSEQINVNLSIGSISAGWEKTGPALVLNDVTFQDENSKGVALSIEQTRMHLNLWQSSLQRRLVSNYFVLSGVNADLNMLKLTTEQAEEQQPSDSGGQIELLETLFLADSGHFAVENSQLNITLRNGKERVVVLDRITWQNRGDKHQGVGNIHLPGISDNSIEVVFDLYGEHFSDSYGELYLAANNLNITPWLNEFLPNRLKDINSSVNFQTWARFKNSGFENIQLSWQASQLDWQTKKPQTLSLAPGTLQWYPTDNGWQLTTSKLALISNNKEFKEFNFELTKQGDKLALLSSTFELGMLGQVAQLLNEPALETIQGLNPQGQVKSVFAEFSENGDFAFAADINELTWQRFNDIPGVQKIAMSLVLSERGGQLKTSGEQGHFITGDLFTKALAYDAFKVDIDLLPQGDSWRLYSQNLWLKNEDLSFAAELDLDLGDTPGMSLYAEMYGPKAIKARHYFPHGYMPQGTIDYLNGALKGGEVKKAQVLWHGAFSAFPYQGNDGQFIVKAHVSDAQFNFTQNWPDITSGDVELLFQKEAMIIRSNAGSLAGLELNRDVTVSIEDLARSDYLYVDINTQQNAQKLQPFFAQTPLSSSLGKVLEIVSGKGVVKGSTRIAVPLSSDVELYVNGEVTLRNNDVLITKPGIPFQNVSGKLRFQDDQITLLDTSATWLGMPLRFDLKGEQKSDAYQLKVSGQGDWPINDLMTQGNGLMVGYLSGEAPLQFDFQMHLPEQGFNYHVNVQSDLIGVNSRLPQPFNKTNEQNWPLLIEAKGDEISNLITASVNNQVYFNSIIDNQSAKMTNAHLIIGERDLGLNKAGFDVSVGLTEADLLEWIPFIDHIINSTNTESDEQSDFFPRLKQIYTTVDSASLANIAFHDLAIELDNLNQSTQLKLLAKELRAEVSIPKVLAQRPIYIDTDYLRLKFKEEQAQTQDAATAQDNTWLTHLPSIRFNCADCKIDRYELDSVRLDLDPAQEGLAITQLIIDKGKHVFNGNGLWRNNVTQLTGTLTSKDIGELADEFDLTSSIKDSKAEATVNLSWQGTPYQFDVTSLNGDMSWRLGEGHLTDISDGGARVFSLLSLDSLVRKLKLDFRDVFSKGFFYNKMEGSLVFEKGIATTDDTKMDGVPADLTIKGYANLVTSEINYDVSVAPEVTSSIPVIVAWMVNPVTGLAALAIDKVIHSARVISEIEFKITGSFEEPIVTERGRKSKEVEIPIESNKPVPASAIGTVEGK